jgi:hypothetical protein
LRYFYYTVKAKIIKLLQMLHIIKYKKSLNRDIINPSTLDGKVMMGYQGWFGCPGDNSILNTWRHWCSPDGTPLVDIYPDVSELLEEELYLTPSGHKVYSSYQRTTTMRHFQWMKDYNLDGVFLQRFVTDFTIVNILNKVVLNVTEGAALYGRVFAIMYDITNASADNLLELLQNDWSLLKVLNSEQYLHHNGKPVIGLWGFGFQGQLHTPQQAKEIINSFKNKGYTIVGGVPTHWRTLSNDSHSNSEWAEIYNLFDIISPWTVGRYIDNKTANNFIVSNVIPDMNEAKEYLPVIFPGYSAHNLQGTPLDEIPRNNGNFYLNQAINLVSVGAKMIYVAMFDECDEGTAVYKVGRFGDEYLKLTNKIGKLLRGEEYD